MNVTKFVSDIDSATSSVGIVNADSITPIELTPEFPSLSSILSSPKPFATIGGLAKSDPIPLDQVTFLPPIDEQEVWAAGVTYKKSQTARMEESEAAASCYDQVYNADRPELFFKAVPHRVRGHLQELRIRADATWNVPEPEVTLVLSNELRIVGLTVGNDMSSRDIEGENPLYLPQAKCYDQSAGLGAVDHAIRNPCRRSRKLPSTSRFIVTERSFLTKRHRRHKWRVSSKTWSVGWDAT